jgi:hypothetical protein
LSPEPRERLHQACRALHDAGRPQDACSAFERGAAELGDDGGDLAIELEAW